MKRKKLATTGSSDEDTRRVLGDLEEATRGGCNTNDPIMEQLKRCPEAFKVGEILGKAFETLKYAQDEGECGNNSLPPSGVVVPPLV